MTLPPLGNSNCIVSSVSVDFSFKSKGGPSYPSFMMYVYIPHQKYFFKFYSSPYYSPALFELFISAVHSYCSAVTLSPLRNSNLIVFSVSVDFPFKSKGGPSYPSLMAYMYIPHQKYFFKFYSSPYLHDF